MMDQEPSDNSRRTLLMVEDEPDLREVLLELLDPFDIDVITASNGKQAMVILSENDGIDAILSDFRMPVMDGLSFLFEVRERGFETPFVLLSGYTDKTSTITALRLRALDLVEKPFDPRDLIARLEVALELGYRSRHFRKHVDQLSQTGALSERLVTKLKEAQRAALPSRTK